MYARNAVWQALHHPERRWQATANDGQVRKQFCGWSSGLGSLSVRTTILALYFRQRDGVKTLPRNSSV